MESADPERRQCVTVCQDRLADVICYRAAIMEARNTTFAD